jgi:hypothetical protein
MEKQNKLIQQVIDERYIDLTPSELKEHIKELLSYADVDKYFNVEYLQAILNDDTT